MGEKGEVLEHHAHLLAAEGLELGALQRLDIGSVDPRLAGRSFEELVHRTKSSGLPRAGEAHHHEYFALGHREVNVPDAYHMA